ncbi:MAG TPA: IclR family transcriptional regulator [Burkholderiaceae bacterium]
MVKSAVRTVTILSTLASARGGLLHSEIADALQIPPSSLTALLRDLLELRYVDLEPQTKRYFLGPGVLTLSSAYLKGLDLAKLADPGLRSLFESVNEFTSLVVANGTEITKVREYGVADPLAAHLQLGESGPMHATATGKAILAFAGAARQREYLRDLDMRVYTKHTISSRTQLAQELAEVRSAGIAYCREEYLEGMVSIGAPVFDAREEAIAAIGVNTRAIRFTAEFEAKARPLLLATAQGLSQRLGSVSALTVLRASPGRAKPHA